ncbi:ABC transporter ATP-binding protein [Alcaligenaceae bacterium]|nr:ABC transporter ATP-binding protein [Alcaligenaceae bacterium]
MFSIIKELFGLLRSRQRKRIYVLQVLVILMTFAEIAGVAGLGAFMALIADVDAISGEGFYGKLYQLTGFSAPDSFIVGVGSGVLAILLLGAMLSVITTWRLSLLGQAIGVELSDRLYQHYLHQPWLFHTKNHSSFLINKIAGETGRITNSVIIPLLQVNAKVVFAVFMLLTVFIFNPLVATLGVLIFGTAYLVLYRSVGRLLINNGVAISEANAARHKLMSEGFGGIKDVLLLGRQMDFMERYHLTGQDLARANAINTTIGNVPRYLMEVVAFGAVIVLVIYLVKVQQGNMTKILPVLAMYALAGFKLLPAFQAIYLNVSIIKSGIPAFEIMKKDLECSQEEDFLASAASIAPPARHPVRDSIALRNVTFTYPGKPSPVLSNLNLIIPVNKTVGIVGSSGSGKSTTIDLLLGLILPDQGQLLIDEQPLAPTQVRLWQNVLGFVPQSIFLADGTIAENIAFGLPKDQIDYPRVQRAIELAHLDKLVEQLKDGINTRVGERGVQLSGGQRQRIGIARALYHDAEVLILDEATSSLDGVTEKLIMDAIQDFSGKKTIIMIAHRLATVKSCDIIYFMDRGSVLDQGTYDELLERNVMFRKMALHA